MSKYNFALDIDAYDSAATILKNIKPNSRVLELGCAYGRMTKYMKESLNCVIDTIEVDEEAGMVAATWANQSFGGSLEDLSVWQELNDIKCNNYDYLIFADVLEHLTNPTEVLNRSSNLLKTGGSIWISIPNTAHNSIIIDLLNDKFVYREIGLLDNTHIKLFTINSILEMIKKSGLVLNERIDLSLPVENTEFNNSYQDVPTEVASFLKKRPLGEVYQFVMELKKP